jgi:DNA-binding SARP family transcriptional activator/tetratricopeptide (TPR) repeat protein
MPRRVAAAPAVPPSPGARPLVIRLLGPLEIVVAGSPIVVDTRKALAIVALVAAEGRPFARDELAAMFWPEADDEAARGALRRTLSALRSAVDGPGLSIERTRVALDPVVASVDLTDLERLAASDRRPDLEAAAALARGPFLAGFALRDSPAFDDWQAGRAIRVERTVSALFDRLGAARAADGDAAGAIEAARRRVELDPLDEPGQRRLIELLTEADDRAGAIRQYRLLVALFDRELGVAPLRETTDLYESIRDEAAAAPRVVGGIRPPVRPARPDRPVSPPSAAPDGARSTSAAGSPFVGRDRELTAILATAAAASPDGRLIIVEGEAGIGKTRLAEVAVDRLHDRGATVLATRGYPGEAAIAYGPIADLLRTGIGIAGGPRRLTGLDPTALGEIGRLADLPAALRSAARPTASTADYARVRLLDAISDALTALAGGPIPGIVWIDDLHLADESTRQAVTYLARRLQGRPIALLLAWRREELTVDGLATADDLARVPGVVALTLERLDRAAIVQLVRASAGSLGATSEAFIDSVFAGSEGLPLHVVETLASDEPGTGSVSRGVRELLRERIGSVGEVAAQVLSAAAVIGRSFDLTTVRGTSGRSDEETVDGLEELMRRGIVREIDGGPDGSVRYDFSHGRLRDAAYEGTSLARRRLLHGRTADALRLDIAAVTRDGIAQYARIAGHERLAGRTAEAAAAYLEAAGRAEAVFANREAIEHLEASLALGRPDAAAIHARIGELRARLGEYPAAIGDLETAAALASTDQLPGIELQLGRVHRRRGDLAAAASHLEEALMAIDLPPTLRVRSLVERSRVALQAGDLGAASETAREARTLAASTGDPHGAGVAERLVGLVAQAGGDLSTARDAFERSQALGADDPDPTAAIAATTALAVALAADGELDAAVDAASVAIEGCRRIGDRHLEAAVENHLADLLHEAGRELDAMAHLKRAVALFAEIGDAAPQPDPGIWALAAW